MQHLAEHKDKVIRCRICNKEFKTITKLRRHTKAHVNQCPLCSVNFLTPQALQDHMKESHGPDPETVDRQCSLCKFTCNHTSKKLTEHINQEHAGEQTIYACLYCTQPFNQYSEYLQHLAEHKDKVIRCRICNKEFKTITKLRRHTKAHVNQCPLCSVNFLTPQALQDHMKESHRPDPETVDRQCSLCEFTCNNMSELAEHNQSVHHPYSCNICFLCFSAEYKLVDQTGHA